MPSNALDSITIQGFKSIASIEKLPLRPINIVIGANGSGKSNFVGVFDFLHEIREGRLRDYVERAGGADKLLHFGSKSTRDIHFDLSSPQGHWELRLRPTGEDLLYGDLYINEEALRLGRNGPADSGYSATTDEEIATWEKNRKTMLDLLSGWRTYHLHDTSFSSSMRKTARVDDNQFLRPDGANLAAFLYLLRERHLDSYRLIVRTVQLAAPFSMTSGSIGSGSKRTTSGWSGGTRNRTSTSTLCPYRTAHSDSSL